MIFVPELARWQRLKPDVVFHVWCRHHYRSRLRELEEHALQSGESRRVLMLDDLNQSRRVESFQSPVPVGERAVEQLDAILLSLRHLFESQALGCDLKRAV